MASHSTHLRLTPWSIDDLVLLQQCNAPELMEHLGGPESDEKVLARHAKYVRFWTTGEGFTFKIESDEHPEGLGIINYWPTTEREVPDLEAGWTVRAEFQRQGIATRALALVIAHAAANTNLLELHAFPKLDNAASNAVCRKSGMRLLGEVAFEYPPGNPIVSNDWVIDLDGLRR